MENTLINQQQAGEKLLGVLFFTLVISVMNANIFSIVLPVIMKEFQLTSSQVSWTTTGYMIIYAIGSVTYGKLADRFRLKDLLTFGLIFTAMGSVIGLVADKYWMVVAGRMLQAAGASVVPATAMIIPLRYFSPEKRGRALGTISAGGALGFAVGPSVAGLISGLLNWRFLFYISVLTLFTLPFYRRYLDDERGKPGKIDLLGGSLLAGATALMLLALTNVGWLQFIIGFLFLALFIVRIRSTDAPFIQPVLFHNQNYMKGMFIVVIAYAANMTIPFVLPLMLSEINHISSASIGFIMFPGAMLSALLGRAGGKLADRKGNPFVFYIAGSLLIFSLIVLSAAAGISPILIALVFAFWNVGKTITEVALANMISRTLTRENAGVGMGLYTMIIFLTIAASTTLMGKVLDFYPADFRLNIFLINPVGVAYSNIFAVLALVVALNVLLYYKILGQEGFNRLVQAEK